MPDFDDKDLVIFAVFFICLALIWKLGPESISSIDNALSGLFGVAVGKSLK